MQRIDTFPTNRIKNLEYRIGRVFPFGASITDGGVNFSIFSKDAESCTLVLFHHGQKKPFVEIPFPEEFRIGSVYTMSCWTLTQSPYPAGPSGAGSRIPPTRSPTAASSCARTMTGTGTNRSRGAAMN